jgi:hypothetical protein
MLLLYLPKAKSIATEVAPTSLSLSVLFFSAGSCFRVGADAEMVLEWLYELLWERRQEGWWGW